MTAIIGNPLTSQSDISSVTPSGSTVVTPEEAPDVAIIPSVYGLVVDRTLTLMFNWNRPVNGFTQGDVQLFFWDNAAQQAAVSGHLSNFVGGNGERIFSATLNLPANHIGTCVVLIPIQSAAASDDDTLLGPLIPRSIEISYNTEARQPTIPDVTIVVPSTVRSTPQLVRFNWTEAVGGFDASDVDLVGVGDSIVNFQQTDEDGMNYSGYINPPANDMGTGSITVRMNSAQGASNPGPAMDRTVTFNYDTTTAVNTDITGATVISTRTKTTDDGAYNGVFEVKQVGDYAYWLTQIMHDVGSTPNNFIDEDRMAHAELVRIDKRDNSVAIVKAYDYITTAGRSFTEHKNELHLLEGSHYMYLGNDDIDTIVVAGDDGVNKRVRTYAWKDNVGNIVRISGTMPIEVGRTWRSAFVNPDEEEAPRDEHYGVHGGTASPMISKDDVLHFVAGYGNLNDNITDIEHAVSDYDNWQSIQIGTKLNLRVPLLETNDRTGWEIMQDVAKITDSVIGFDVDRFFSEPHDPASALLNGAIDASANSASIDNANRDMLPTSGLALVGNELIRYTRSGAGLTLTERGVMPTTAAAHADNAKVLFVDYIIDINQDTPESPIDNVTYVNDIDQIFNKIIVKYGESEATPPAIDPLSMAQYGEQLLEVETILDRHQSEWAELHSERLLERFKDIKQIITLDVRYSPHIKVTDIVYLSIPYRAHIQKACEVLEFNHSIERTETGGGIFKTTLTLRTL